MLDCMENYVYYTCFFLNHFFCVCNEMEFAAMCLEYGRLGEEEIQIYPTSI